MNELDSLVDDERTWAGGGGPKWIPLVEAVLFVVVALAISLVVASAKL